VLDRTASLVDARLQLTVPDPRPPSSAFAHARRARQARRRSAVPRCNCTV